MSTIGIVCEFNPFHNGHKYLIDTVRNDGDTIVCVMSGNFTQRAEPALFEKSVRVRAALNNGADIVLELPFVYATATAEVFAKNAVRILCEFGCDKIAFGVEDDNHGELMKAAEVLSRDSFKTEIEAELKNDISYPAARQRAFAKHSIAFDISKPNNILAVEYAKSVLTDYPSVELLPIKRMGTEHDSDNVSGRFASAEHLREVFGFSVISGYVPESAYELYRQADAADEILNPHYYALSLLTLLRIRLYETTDETAYMTDELESRLQAAVREYSDTDSLDGLYNAVKTKRYTASRVRRAVLYKAFGASSEFMKLDAPYIRLLGFKSGSENVIARAKEKSKLPLVSTYREIKSITDEAVQRVFELESKATDIYNLSLSGSKPCGTEMTRKIIKL